MTLVNPSLFFRHVTDIISGFKVRRNDDDDGKEHVRSVSATLLYRLIEAFAEAAPQLVLQLYIMLKNPSKSIG